MYALFGFPVMGVNRDKGMGTRGRFYRPLFLDAELSVCYNQNKNATGDAGGTPVTLIYNGTVYYYVKNQGTREPFSYPLFIDKNTKKGYSFRPGTDGTDGTEKTDRTL